jgi:hypothetical protein
MRKTGRVSAAARLPAWRPENVPQCGSAPAPSPLPAGLRTGYTRTLGRPPPVVVPLGAPAFGRRQPTKLRYYTPSFAGFQLGLSWTPNTEDDGDELAPKDVPIGD